MCRRGVIYVEKWRGWFKQFIPKLSTKSIKRHFFCLFHNCTKPPAKRRRNRQSTKHLPPDRQTEGKLQISTAYISSVEIQIKHTLSSALVSVTLKHTNTCTHAQQTPSVTPDCCRVSTENNPTQLLLWRSPALCAGKTCQDLHWGEITESQGLIILSWLLLHIYYLLFTPAIFTGLVLCLWDAVKRAVIAWQCKITFILEWRAI